MVKTIWLLFFMTTSDPAVEKPVPLQFQTEEACEAFAAVVLTQQSMRCVEVETTVPVVIG